MPHIEEPRPPMRVLAFPCSGSAYTEAFYRAIRAQGMVVTEGVFAGRWLISTVRRGDIAHFHWPSFQYTALGSYPAALTALLRFLVLLILLRLLGARIVWTAHNLLPHDLNPYPWIDRFARRIVIAFSEKIFVHGTSPAATLAARFPRTKKKLVLIPHGHFIDFYPDTLTRAEARRYFGFQSSRFVYLFIGLCKPYKNLDGLVQTFRRLTGDVGLLVAGKFQNLAYETQIRALAYGDDRIKLDARFIPDEELQIFLHACDAVVVPYREILTSGSAVLAMSFGRPVVTIDRGFLHDVVTATSGVLYDPEDTSGLANALSAVSEISWEPQTIRNHISQFRFEDAARIFLASLNPAPSMFGTPK